MELYDLMKNILGNNNEEELIKSIETVRLKLNGLTKERMCIVYSSYLFRELLKHHVPSRLINTLDFNLWYEHVFILTENEMGGGYFLVDLTFSQFNISNSRLKKLLTDGYQLVNDEDFNFYLSNITGKDIEGFCLDDIFYKSNPSNNLLK